MVVKTGAYNYIQWGEEAIFGTAPAACTLNKPFGYEQKITNWSFTNNPIPLAQLDNIHIKNYAYGQTRGSLGLEFVLASPFWLRNIFGAPVVCGCADPFCNSYAIACATHEYCANSFTVEIGQDNLVACTDVTRRLSGAIVNTASIRSTVGEVVRASLDISYSSEVEDCVCIDAAPAAENICNDIPYTFAEGALVTREVCCPSTTVTVAEVQDIDISINTNQELLYGHGSHTAVSAFKRLFDLTGSFKASYINTFQYDNILQQVAHDCTTEDREQHSLILTFTNGVVGAGLRDMIFTFGGISIRSHDLSIEPNEPVFQTIPWQARTLSVTANTGAAEP